MSEEEGGRRRGRVGGADRRLEEEEEEGRRRGEEGALRSLPAGCRRRRREGAGRSSEEEGGRRPDYNVSAAAEPAVHPVSAWPPRHAPGAGDLAVGGEARQPYPPCRAPTHRQEFRKRRCHRQALEVGTATRPPPISSAPRLLGPTGAPRAFDEMMCWWVSVLDEV
ncbi:hypothetical protein PR202_ga07481 [Eleusine coracana subsp. coracana]|uniref:Uncharacterized protein n=1 Tax=Eleusine coracana subsp. coracana TaxID=191504 RepID=A0AAV5BZB7_ELECO|nr:hypothetical protein PR202_ga07481 [Eleusine coracana subsp. coracana]